MFIFFFLFLLDGIKLPAFQLIYNPSTHAVILDAKVSVRFRSQKTTVTFRFPDPMLGDTEKGLNILPPSQLVHPGPVLLLLTRTRHTRQSLHSPCDPMSRDGMLRRAQRRLNVSALSMLAHFMKQQCLCPGYPSLVYAPSSPPEAQVHTYPFFGLHFRSFSHHRTIAAV